MSGLPFHGLPLAEGELRLVTRCLEGDSLAWETMVSRYGDRIRRMAYRYLSRRDDADDLAQEVFIRVYRNLDTFRADTGSLQNWLVRVGRNLIIDHFRHSRRMQQHFGSREMETMRLKDDWAPLPDRDMERTEASEIISELLQSLSDDLKQAVVLRYLEGMSYQEIAGYLAVPEGTVKSRINRGRAKLARLLVKRNLRKTIRGGPALASADRGRSGPH